MLYRLLPFLLLTVLILPVQANELGEEDFPTLARVEYVIGCMNQRGGENYDILYGCVCAIDTIRSRFTYDEYSEAATYRMLQSTPGERGGMFRDPEQADALRDRLDQVADLIEQRCFPRQVSQQ
ncbi:MAG: hypothetical protein R3202_07435 [Candidatus Competibacterales bacterium]|nr:hypothetical protein [Candidatus Competibacterales bacterium]